MRSDLVAFGLRGCDVDGFVVTKAAALLALVLWHSAGLLSVLCKRSERRVLLRPVSTLKLIFFLSAPLGDSHTTTPRNPFDLLLIS